MIANLINVPWVNQYSALQQFAAGLVLAGLIITVDVLYHRRGK